MTSDYELFEQKQKEIQDENQIYLESFKKWLQKQGFTKKTITNHISNVDLYINDFLCYYDAQDAKEGCYKISSFLGDWFIRKVMWSSCAHIKSNSASLKKFYAFLLEIDVVKQDDYDLLCKIIKNEMSDWLNEMRRYDEMEEDF